MNMDQMTIMPYEYLVSSPVGFNAAILDYIAATIERQRMRTEGARKVRKGVDWTGRILKARFRVYILSAGGLMGTEGIN